MGAVNGGKATSGHRFSRTGDADTGDFDDPVVLATHGDVRTFE
ncbi:hypothetical protein [Devosia soli]|nr:hypothetical protein [Devosia soli]